MAGTRYTYGIYVPDIDDHGTVKGFIALVNDMTEFRSMEQKIAEALEFNQTILESSPIGIITFDSSGQLVFSQRCRRKNLRRNERAALQQNLNFNQLNAWKQTGLLDVARQVLATGRSDNSQVIPQICLRKRAMD